MATLPNHPRPAAAEQLTVPAAGAWQGGSLQSLLAGTGTTSFLVLRDGQLAHEWYAPNFGADTVTRTLSVTKSVASLLVGQAVGDGRLSVDASLGDLLPGLVDPRVAAMTVEQLMRMSSGIRYREGVTPWSDDALVYHGSDWSAAHGSTNSLIGTPIGVAQRLGEKRDQQAHLGGYILPARVNRVNAEFR
jgi:CubicO group peptidase (beta-lactamase class C family)